jgi:hypothetical protein
MDLGEFRLIRVISRIGKRLKVEVSNFCGNLNPEECINWINDMEDHFEYEEIKDPKRVNLKNTN